MKRWGIVIGMRGVVGVWGISVLAGIGLSAISPSPHPPISPSPHPPISPSPRPPISPSVGPSSEFRIFLKDGRVLNSYGECATLPEELVCVVKLGGGEVTESHDVLTVPLDLVDEARTRNYARALRAAQYGASRGEREYTEMTAELTRVMAELESSTDRDRRLGIALMARQRLATWSAEHFDYKAAETRQLVGILDEVIAELRIAAGDTRFSLDMVANLAAVEAEPLLPAPALAASLDAALSAAEVTPIAVERLALLRSAARVASATPHLDAALRSRITRTLQDEEAVERRYQALMADVRTRADVAVRHGRPSALQRLIWEVEAQDQALGARRPREMAAFGRRLAIELSLAREQEAAFERWTAVKDQLLAYELRLRSVFDGWVTQRAVLRDVRAGTPARASVLDAAVRRFTALDATLKSMRPLPEVQEVHALFRSAVQMARQGLILGQRVAVARNAEVARNASSAVAGAELLLAQGRTELVAALNPRKVR